MIVSLLTAVISAIIAFKRPVWGFGIYLLFNTGMRGFFPNMVLNNPALGPFQPEDLAYIMAIASLILKRSGHGNASLRPSILQMTVWILTATMFVSTFVNLAGLGRGQSIVREAVYCMMWAPLLMAFGKMGDEERSNLRKSIIIFSAITSLFSIIIVISGNQYLADLLCLRYSETDFATSALSARVTVPGIWSIVPLGFWLSIKELAAVSYLERNRRLYAGVAAGLMLIAFLLNLTRTVMISVVFAILVFWLVYTFSIGLKRRQRKLNLGIPFLFIALTLLTNSLVPGLFESWRNRLVSLGDYRFGEGSVYAREIVSKRMLNILIEKMPLIGYKEVRGFSKGGITGDPHGLIGFWWNYGLLGAFILICVLLISLSKLAKVLILQSQYPQEDIVYAAVLISYNIQFIVMMVGCGFRHIEVFALIFFLGETEHTARKHLRKDRISAVNA